MKEEALNKSPRISNCKESREWYHGSPARLITLRSGSTVTQKRTLAKVFSHKPELVKIEIKEDEAGSRTVVLEQDGTSDGYLYRVIPDNPETDIRKDPESTMLPGDEVLITRELSVELLEKVPLRVQYLISPDP